MSDKAFVRLILIILCVLWLWMTYNYGYIMGYADACQWCTEMYSECNVKSLDS